MKKFTCALALATLVGCGRGTPGGPGATAPNNRASEAFTIDVPNLPTSIKQGETQAIDLAVVRGKDFAQDVTLDFGELPKGVTFEPASATVRANEQRVQIKVLAAEAAATGDFIVKVAGKPKEGPAAGNEFKLKIERR